MPCSLDFSFPLIMCLLVSPCVHDASSACILHVPDVEVGLCLLLLGWNCSSWCSSPTVPLSSFLTRCPRVSIKAENFGLALRSVIGAAFINTRNSHLYVPLVLGHLEKSPGFFLVISRRKKSRKKAAQRTKNIRKIGFLIPENMAFWGLCVGKPTFL